MPRHMFQITVMNVPASVRNNINTNEVFNPYMFVRNHLYHLVFHRFCLLYVRLCSEIRRKLIEFSILLVSLFCFITLIYVHVVFVQTPITCLDNYRDIWQNNGILRVEVLSRKGKVNYTLEDSYWKEKTLRLQQFDMHSYFFYSDQAIKESKDKSVEDAEMTEEEAGLDGFNSFNVEELKADNYSTNSSDLNKVFAKEENFQPISEESILASDPEGSYIMEFSLEYGYLRLRPSKRRELNISVIFVVLDPEVDQCFGGSFNKFLLDNFLGYDNVLLASIKNMAERKDQKGFVRNAVMEIEYIFINNWSSEKSYLTAGFVMLIFTLTISTLLRHSHHQIFIVVGFWMHHIITSLERPSNFFDVVWPRNLIPSSGAPVLTVILALVGMEAVMSDFFHDRSIALHVIVIVWFADLFDAVCCQSPLSKRHWYKFFCLYHFMFYAYNYKFSGVYWPLTLMTSWLFTLHSMVFFFHHYELPRHLHRVHRVNANHVNNSTLQNSPPDHQPPPPTEADNPLQAEPPGSTPEENAGDDMEIDPPPNSSNELPTADSLVNDGAPATLDSSHLAGGSADPLHHELKPRCYEDCHSLQVNQLLRDEAPPHIAEHSAVQKQSSPSPEVDSQPSVSKAETQGVDLSSLKTHGIKNCNVSKELSAGAASLSDENLICDSQSSEKAPSKKDTGSICKDSEKFKSLCTDDID